MNVVQFRAPGTPAPKDPPNMSPLPWPNRPPVTRKGGLKPPLTSKQKRNGLLFMAWWAARSGLTTADVAAFFSARVGA